MRDTWNRLQQGLVSGAVLCAFCCCLLFVPKRSRSVLLAGLRYKKKVHNKGTGTSGNYVPTEIYWQSEVLYEKYTYRRKRKVYRSFNRFLIYCIPGTRYLKLLLCVAHTGYAGDFLGVLKAMPPAYVLLIRVPPRTASSLLHNVTNGNSLLGRPCSTTLPPRNYWSPKICCTDGDEGSIVS